VDEEVDEESTVLLRVSMSVHSTLRQDERGNNTMEIDLPQLRISIFRQDERGNNTMEIDLPQLRISIFRRRKSAVGNPDSRDNGRTQVKCNIHLPVEVKDNASVFQD
jgi:hypothetical protein